MKDCLMNHKVTLLLRADVLGPDSRIINEDEGITSHVAAYKNIENNLQKRGIPSISNGINELDKIVQTHLSFGNSLIHNMCVSGENKFIIYMPENINSLDKNIIRGFIKELSDIDEITLYQQEGSNHTYVSVDEFLHPKMRLLDTIGHNFNNTNKKGLNI